MRNAQAKGSSHLYNLLQKNKSKIHPIMYNSIYNSEWKEIKKLILKYNKS